MADQSVIQELEEAIEEVAELIKTHATKAFVNTAVSRVSDAVEQKQDKLTFDSTPTEDSNNMVNSGAVYEAVNGLKDNTDVISKLTAEPIKSIITANNAYISAVTGRVVSGSSFARWAVTNYINIEKYDYLVYSRCCVPASSSSGGIAFYSSENETDYISGERVLTNYPSFGSEDWIVKVPDGAKFVRMSVITEAGFYVKGIGSNPLKGLKLSLLGASIESFEGAIPAGNDAYYTGANYGVNNINEMWWKVLCNNTGMIPLVIDAWSGSSVCYNYSTDNSHSDTSKIPMCSDLRTGRLGTETDNPDIIIVVGGTNDWTYSEQSTTPLGNWDGRTSVDRQAVLSGNSTFMESYASMIDKLHTNYPDAIIVGVSTEFTGRGTNVGITKVNDMGLTQNDYSEAIRKVCKIMGIPYIDVYNIGFTFQNYYPNYCEDSPTNPTHPNALGHAMIAKRFIDELPRLVKQFKG